MGASILPITIYKGKIYFLFGKERTIDDTPGWSDFGGGTDNGESFMETATREGVEELTGFLGDKHYIKTHIQKFGTHTIDYNSPGYATYRCHLYPIIYDDKLTFYYNNNHKVIQSHLDLAVIKKSKIFEKTEIRWFSFNDIKRKRTSFRSFYKNIIDLLIIDKLNIQQFVRANSLFKRTHNQSRKRKHNSHNKTKRRP